MLSLLLAGAVAQTPVAPAAAFFPLRPRSRMFYEEKSLQASQTVDVVGEPIDVAGSPASPVVTFQNGNKVNTTYYRVEGDTVYVVAYDHKNPLRTPMTVLKVPEGNAKTTFVYSDQGGTERQPEPVEMRGESQRRGEREVLGKKVAILEVRITATMGSGRLKESIEQKAIYGEGIGLVELTSTTKLARRQATSILRLVKIEETQGAG